MRHAHICPHCDHRSTRWWNLKVHIKRRHGGLLFDRSLDSNPLSLNNPPATVADSVAYTFQLRDGPQQSPQGISQYYTNPIYRSLAEDQNYGTGLSRETKLKELKRLAYRYPRFHNTGPDEIVRYAAYWSINGDDSFLDAKLEQLSLLDSYSTWQNGHSIE